MILDFIQNLKSSVKILLKLQWVPSLKKVFLQISENSQENTCPRPPAAILKRDSGTGVSLLILRNF